MMDGWVAPMHVAGSFPDSALAIVNVSRRQYRLGQPESLLSARRSAASTTGEAALKVGRDSYGRC